MIAAQVVEKDARSVAVTGSCSHQTILYTKTIKFLFIAKNEKVSLAFHKKYVVRFIGFFFLKLPSSVKKAGFQAELFL